MKKAAIGLIYLYRLCLRPILGENCRFHPSCSEYAIEALQKYGLLRGCWRALMRIIRCNPWHPGGFDPLP